MPFGNDGSALNQAISIGTIPNERAAEVERVQGARERLGFGQAGSDILVRSAGGASA